MHVSADQFIIEVKKATGGMVIVHSNLGIAMHVTNGMDDEIRDTVSAPRTGDLTEAEYHEFLSRLREAMNLPEVSKRLDVWPKGAFDL